MKKFAAAVSKNAQVLWMFMVLAIVCGNVGHAQVVVTNDPPEYGPFNGVFLQGGDGLHKPIGEHDTVLRADLPWSFYFWMKTDEAIHSPMLIAGLGDVTEEYPRYLAADGNNLILWMGKNNSILLPSTLAPANWHLLAVTFSGTEFHLYSDGAQLGGGKLDLGTVNPILQMAPPLTAWPNGRHFGGKIAAFTIVRKTLSSDEIKKIYDAPYDFTNVVFEEGSKSWGVQTRGQAGYRAPQDPSTIPVSKAPFSKPFAQPLPASHMALQENADNAWTIVGDWKLAEAPKVTADGPEISKSGFNAKDWYAATVPGTVLTTLVDRGVYPDPDYGLNNLNIPESLNKQDYWYRAEFKAPSSIRDKHLTLTFQGINYKAAVWLNGQPLGAITGAFIRGVFDVTNVLKPGANFLAVRISPPPHPGIPQEQSIKGGPGENGGIMCLDGPTFVASEGWDWIPAIRDRNSGIWQPVTLTATAAVKIGDPQVVTTLALPDTSRADVEITVPLENDSDAPVQGTLNASFEQVTVSKNITIAPGKSEVKLTPAEFAQLTVQNPRLWWPNGYGKQELYHLKLSVTQGKSESDVKQLRFGIREITYELSLLDSMGHMRRVEYSPTVARVKNERVVDITHNGMRQIPAADPPPPDFPPQWREFWRSWVASLYPGAESSPSIKALDDTRAAPYLVIKVNGVRIACRGGSWGMDDSRKRVSRERLEPFFKLHHDANVNMIRNWVGQDTEEVFYDLADEYGLLIWNDFWETTQDYNIEAQDPDLFLNNARDTILHFRNHPSIVAWCGRNEGVPQPVINEGLEKLISTLDGTRYYSPSSNQVNLQNSGPYKYQDPVLYYTALNHGFSVETGTQSMSTLESFRATTPQADQWPIDDVWAYHDWHASGNGDTAPFMAQLQAEFGAATSLEDFERKAQMLNYVDHRAIFEGMNAHLWAPNSARMLWMTQPAWPSTMWQIMSHDYDTQASFYAVKKACEPVHVQLDLSNGQVDVVNTTIAPLAGLFVTADVYTLDNKRLAHAEEHKDIAADTEITSVKLELGQFLQAGMVLVKLELHDAAGKLLSDNFYWLGAENSSYRELNRLAAATLAGTASSSQAGDTVHVHVQLKNTGAVPAIADKLTLISALNGDRILPAYLSDNYVSLLAGETRDIDIEYPASAGKGAAQLAVRGWNLSPFTIAVASTK
jgi:hypothetical protein